MIDSVDEIWKWLANGGFDKWNKVSVSVTRYQGDCFRLTLEAVERQCNRCLTRGPSALVRMIGSCSACTSVRDSGRLSTQIAANDLLPLLREDFEFQDDDGLREQYMFVRNGVSDNGAVVHIFLKERIQR